MSERYPVGTKVQVKNDGHGSQYRSDAERVGEFAGTVVAVNGPKYTGIPEVCVESETGERRVILVGDLEEGVAAPEPEAPTVTEYSVKIWYRSGAYEGVPHCPENLARKVYADAVKSSGVEFAELHGPSGILVESKPPMTKCGPRTISGLSGGVSYIYCVLAKGHDGPHTVTPNEESTLTTEPELPTENLFLASLPLLHPEPLPPAPELQQGPEPTA